MLVSNMLVKKWYKIQILSKSKQFKVTKQVFNTKSEGLEKGISKGYEILNLKAINKLLGDGWTEYQANDKNVVTGIISSQNAINVNDDIERQIEAYTIAKIERDIKAYEEKKRRQLEIERFLTPQVQVKQKPFDYSKQMDKYITKQAPRNQRDKQRQIEDYCSL